MIGWPAGARRAALATGLDLVSIPPTMGLILTATAGLCIWIILWAIGGLGGFDSILIGIVMVLIAIAIRNLLPRVPGRRS